MGSFDKQKQEERNIIDLFIKEYDPSIEILSFQQAQKVFPEYNQDNPDFIIEFKGEFIGVELFRLIPDNFETGAKGIKNNAHYAKVYKGFVEVPFITEASFGQINKKMLKLKNYVCPKIWLLGYAIEYYNTPSLRCAIEDGLDQFIQGILSNINLDTRVEKIFLLESRAENILIDILDPTSYQ